MWFRSTLWSKKASVRFRYFRPQVQALEDRCLMSAGALDPTFGAAAGYVTTSLSGTTSDWAKAVLVQPNGNIVVAGQTAVSVTTPTKHGTTTTNVNTFGAVTYNPDGSLDAAFGSGGIVRQLFAGNSGGILHAAALEPMGTTGDSKILLAGTDGGQYGMALMRLNANGTLDTSFGNNGQVVTPFQTSSANASGDTAEAVAVTSGGQILVMGEDLGSNTVLLARYNPNGSLDPTFGHGGTATTVLSTGGVLGMALQPDGKIVVAGGGTFGNATNSSGLVLRYTANGTLDATFGNGGMVTTAIPFGVSPSTGYSGVAVYPNAGTANDGKIIAVGHVSSSPGSPQNQIQFTVARYNPNGSLDSSFAGGTGYEVILDPNFTYPHDMAQAVVIESDGKPIIVGNSYYAPNPCYSQVVRLNVDGSPDTTFGNGGFVDTAVGTTVTGGTYSRFSAVAIQPDGKIDAAGMAESVSGNKFTLARYLPSAPQIGSFTASPSPVTSGTATTLTASNISDGNAGAAVTQVTFYYDDGTGTKQMLGYGTSDGLGDWALSYTVGLAPGSYTLYAQALDSDGVFGDPVALTLQVM
jgi:uncharacterized delta-60 repeat protein